MTKPNTQKRARRTHSADASDVAATLQEPAPKRTGKVPTLVALLKRPEGATIAAMMEATGWQAHSVRGAMSGAIGKSLGLKVTSEKTEAGRVYRIAGEAQA